MDVRFEYTLTGAGWADAAVFADGEKIAMTVSYLHDSLRQLLEEVAELAAGRGAEARVVFMDEPGEHWLVIRREEDDAELEIRWYDDWASWKMSPEDRYSIRFCGKIHLEQFATSVLEAAQKLLRNGGAEGYKQKWCEHEFPMEAYEALRKS